MNNYYITFVIIAAALAFSACNPGEEKIEGFCAHPAIAGGASFPIPPGAQFTASGQLFIPTPEGGITLTGAACIIVRRSGK